MGGEDVLSLIQQFAAPNQEAVAKLGTFQQGQEQASNEAVAAQQKLGAAEKVIAEQKAKADMEVQVQTQVFEQMAGGKVTDPNSLMAKLVQDRVESEKGRLQQAQVIKQMDSVSFLDNPIQYITNAFTINSEIDKHNFYADQSAADSSAIQALQTSTQEANKTALATANVMTQATQAAMVEKAAQAAAVTLAKLKIDLAGNNMQGINALMAGQQHAVQNAYTGMRVQLDMAAEGRAQRAEFINEEKWKLEQERFLMQTQMENLQIDALKAKMAEHADDVEMQKQYALLVQKGAAQYKMDPSKFSLPAIKLLEKTSEGKAQIDRLTKAGIISSTTIAGSLGTTPGEALFHISEAGTVPAFQLGPEAGTVNRLLAVKEAVKSQVTSTNPKEAAAELVKLIDDKVVERINTDSKNAEARDSFYAAPKLTTLVQNNPELKKQLLFATVLQPMIDAGITDITSGTIHAQIQEAVKRGVLPEGQAMSEGAKIFEAVAAHNNLFGKFAELGIPTQKGYVVPGPQRPGFFVGDIGVPSLRFDLTKPEEFTKWYLYNSLASKLPALTKLFGTGPAPMTNLGATEYGTK